MPLMTKQEMFDMAVRGLAKQGWHRAVTENGSCKYEIGALRCAYSHCMTDEFRQKVIADGMNGVPATEIMNTYPEEAPYTADADGNFETALQRVHDGSQMPQIMVQAFSAFAMEHDLTWPADVEV